MSDHPDSDPRTPRGADDSQSPASGPAEGASGEVPPIVHLYVLLDRSGSMATMSDDVIGGFNRLLTDQQADGPDARVTLVQFDSHDRHEVLADAVPICEMVPLDHATFVPRGSTPLLDATGLLLSRAVRRAGALAAAGLPAENVVVVSITDGHENASEELTLTVVRQLIDQHTADGWTFVFLSAALDVYREAGALGYDSRSAQAWSPDGDGASVAFDSLSAATSSHRHKIRTRQRFDKDDFFEGDKAAERERHRRDR